MDYRGVHVKGWMWKNETRDGMEDGYERWNGKDGRMMWSTACEISCVAPPGALKP